MTLFFVFPVMVLIGQHVEKVDYKGWEAYKIETENSKIFITPDIGGRVIQLEFNNEFLFWENPTLSGVTSPETGLGEEGEWLNYGGEKLWPAPQGWDNDDQWHGPPDAVLDGGAYQPTVVSQSTLHLRSQIDPVTGIQFEREVSAIKGKNGFNILAKMTNKSNKNIRWGIWAIAQLDASIGNDLNSKFRVYCPINPDSKFVKGYGVLFGLVRNPQWQVDQKNGLMSIHYKHLVGKAVLDSHAGWLASVNGETGNVFIQKFKFEGSKAYPDNSSVAVWTQGFGSIFAWGENVVMPEDLSQNPYLVESEILSPFAELAPGEKYEYNYKWFVTNVGGDFPVIDVKQNVLVSELAFSNGILSARLASFSKGRITIKSQNKFIKSFEIFPENPLLISERIAESQIEIWFDNQTEQEFLFEN